MMGQLKGQRHFWRVVVMTRSGLNSRWRRADLNCRPRAYESPALPLSYTAKGAPPAHVWGLLVAGGGFEPPTSGLCVPLQLSLPGEPVCSLDFPFTLGMTR